MASYRKDASENVPLFIRKAYAMIDSCDPEIATWADDGETFVIKDPDVFERTIIPQFYKHAKFSSFVRQLNFYSFRKIKYNDTIRIDPKLEAETANYWRFRHEYFRQGHPELLVHIKRSNGSGASTSSTHNNHTTKAGDKAVSAEVQTLRNRIDEMTKNIDELTAMVHKVSLKQEEDDVVGKKRQRFDTTTARPDEMVSLDESELLDAPPVPDPKPMSATSSDNEFVDQLFTAFSEGEEAFLLDGTPMPSTVTPVPMPATNMPVYALGEEEHDETTDAANDNRPDPELMRRLGDALMLLPKETQEMIINRLIASILNTDLPSVPRVGLPKTDASVEVVPPQTSNSNPPESLTAATLAALLQHYSSQMSSSSDSKTVAQKSIPVIPVHA